MENGLLDIGAATKFNGLYLGLYFNANVQNLTYDTSYNEKVELFDLNGTQKDTVDVSAISKSNPNATYGLLVGIGGLGFKFTYNDNLEITGTQGNTTNTKWDETYRGDVTPYLEVGGSFGPISTIGLGLKLGYDRNQTTTINYGTSVSTVTFSDYTRYKNGNAYNNVTGANNTLLDAEGNYAEPDLFLKMAFGDFVLKNNLAFRIYGTPSHKTDGTVDTLPGVGFSTTKYDADQSVNKWRVAAWDNRFYVRDKIIPSYKISGGSGIVNYGVSAELPITLAFTTHSLNAKVEDPIGGDIEINDFNKRTNFDVKFEPVIKAGVKVKPIEAFSLQGGIQFDIFDWDIKSAVGTKVDAPTDPAKAALLATVVGAVSDNTSVTTTEFKLPNMQWAAGFTVYFKTLASLDFVFVSEGKPGVAPSIYESVGKGLGSDKTSVVLTVKF